MPEIQRLLDNNKKWAATTQEENPEFFSALAQQQTPMYLWIGCSDSRVPANQIVDLLPGDIFVHRNVANLVVHTDFNCLSVLQYAVDVLQVKHIIVCGHYGCGGVQAAMQASDLGILNPWLRNIRDVYRLHNDELEAIQDDEQRYRRLVELNVQEQCVNVLKAPEVQLAYTAGELTVHGWVFDIGTGNLIDLKLNIEETIESIREIYRLN
jgi:carbonic anhydrase